MFFFGTDSFNDQNYVYDLYAVLDKTELLAEETRIDIIFDGVDSRLIERLFGQSVRKLYQEIASYTVFIELDRESELADKFRNGEKVFDESRWYRIKLSKSETELSAFVFNDIGDVGEERNPEELYVESIEHISDRRVNSLFAFFKGSEKVVSKRKLQAVLNESAINAPWHLAVYKVGQGNLSAICSSDNNYPLIYFDVGGGWRFNHKSYPAPLKLCTHLAQIIIISHWDWDHLETARRYWKSKRWDDYFKNKIWIAPTTAPPGEYSRFAAHIINNGGSLLIWPPGEDEINFWAGTLIKFNGPDKNNSGIGLIVNCRVNRLENVLHPADASFFYMPPSHMKDHLYDGLVCVHHGAKFDVDNIPVPISILKPNGCIVYNYGLIGGRPTRYGHPKNEAISAYEAAGWEDRINTIAGNVALHKGSHSNSVHCTPTGGDLDIVSNF